MNTMDRAHGISKLNRALSAVAERLVTVTLRHISTLGDPEIDRVAQMMGRLGRAAYVVRGACGYALRHRLKQRRLSGGNPLIEQEMRRLSASWGVDYKTLCLDIQMYEAFHLPETLSDPERSEDEAFDFDELAVDFEDADSMERMLPADILGHVAPRFVAEECLRASDPREALERAGARLREGKYSREQLRADIRAARSTPVAVRKTVARGRSAGVTRIHSGDEWPAAIEAEDHLRLPLTAPEHRSLSEAARQAGCSPGDLVSQWIGRGCILLPETSVGSLERQRRALGRRRADYLTDLLRMLEMSLVRAGKMVATPLSADRRQDEI